MQSPMRRGSFGLRELIVGLGVLALAFTLIIAALDWFDGDPAHGATCTGVGYLPAVYAGKPSPFEGTALEQLHAYIVRYGQTPGYPSATPPEALRTTYENFYGPTNWGALANRLIPGYVGETAHVSYAALENAGAAGGTGPGGEPLHAGCATPLEATDVAFQTGRGQGWYGTWYARLIDGGSPERAIHVNTPSGVCGPYSVPRSILLAYTGYYFNDPPCGGVPAPTPAPTATPSPAPTPQPTATPAPTSCPSPTPCAACPTERMPTKVRATLDEALGRLGRKWAARRDEAREWLNSHLFVPADNRSTGQLTLTIEPEPGDAGGQR